MSQVGLFSHAACSRHDTGWRHPEHQGRLRAVMGALDGALPALAPHVESGEGEPVDGEAFELVHTRAHLERVRGAVRRAADRGEPVRLDPETVVSGASWEAVRAATGCACDAVDAVLEGRLRAAFCAVRPPGHHATPDRAMGFCLVNGLAVAARRAVRDARAERILIVDWDVHHGNGTQEIFYEDPDVFYLSLHQHPLFPGTGREDERGRGPGEGTTRNLPMPPGLEPGRYVEALLEGVEEAAATHRPDLVLVSAGFDAAERDPLAGFTLKPEHFHRLTVEVCRVTAATACGCVSVLEGGYRPEELGENVVAHLEGLVEAVGEGDGGAAAREAAGARAREGELQEAGIDGWLLFDLEARNRVAAELLGLPEGLSRRWFVLLRPGRQPVALVHRIELSHWEEWPHRLESYVGWEEMEDRLGRMLSGFETVAMEVSPENRIPFLDNVPAGLRDLVESLGPRVVSSAPLLSATYAQWGERGRELHDRAGRICGEVARQAFERALAATAGSGVAVDSVTEHRLAEWIRGRLAERGLEQGDTIVAVGENSARPHYAPAEGRSAPLDRERVLLIDLWGRVAGEPDAVFADQTWMGFLGPELPPDVAGAWDAVREARDGAVDVIRRRVAEGEGLPTGAAVDRRVREILERHGHGDAILHRTGHAMDRVNHGFGPNLDSVETRDERQLVPGVGFSVEPGLYFEGRFGLRSEINVYMEGEEPVITTPDPQERPWTAGG